MKRIVIMTRKNFMRISGRLMFCWRIHLIATHRTSKMRRKDRSRGTIPLSSIRLSNESWNRRLNAM